MLKSIFYIILLTWSTFFSNVSFAEGDIDNLLNHIQQNEIDEFTGSIPENTELEWWESGEVNYEFDFSSISSKLSFILAYEDLSTFTQLKLTEEEIKNIATKIVEMKLVETFDEHHSETQFTCEMMVEANSEEEKLCQKVLLLFESLSEEIDNIINTTPAIGGKIEDLFGISLDGEHVTQKNAIDEDPHHDLKVEADATPNRNSVILRHHVVKDSNFENQDITIQGAICNIEKREELNIANQLIDHSVNILKELLIDIAGDAILSEQQAAFCTLYEYWNATDNFDEIIEFLYLHQPDGDLPCND